MSKFSESSAAILAPGQGCHFPGMGEELFTGSEAAKRIFYAGSEASGVDLAEACFGSDTDSLEDTRVAQPAIAAVSLAAFAELKKKGFRPEAGTGHSAGELCLLGAAGSLAIQDTFRLISARAEITHEAAQERPGKMAVVRNLSKEQVSHALADLLGSGRVFIANLNSSSQTVLTGDEDLLQKAQDAIRAVRLKDKLQGAKFSILKISGAFHSPHHMERAVEPFYETAQKLKFKEPQFSVMLNNTRYLHEMGTDNLAGYLAGQLVSGVDFVGGTERLYNDGIRNFVDIGPKPILGHLVAEDYGGKVRVATAKEVVSMLDNENSELYKQGVTAL